MQSPTSTLLFFLAATTAVVAVAAAATATATNTTTTVKHAAFIPNHHLKTPDNDTVYRATLSLCLRCLPDSLEFLFYHNLIRATHLEFPLFWDSDLESYARWWADQRRGDCKLQHSFPENGFKLGENIFWGGGSKWRPEDAVGIWAGEAKYYRYDSNTCTAGEMCGHYTQIVWKTTLRVGCARVVCDDGDVFMTCNYDPPGNYVGERPY